MIQYTPLWSSLMRATTLVPGSANGAAAKLNLTKLYPYADNIGLFCADRSRFNIMLT